MRDKEKRFFERFEETGAGNYFDDPLKDVFVYVFWWVCDNCGRTSGKVREIYAELLPRGWSTIKYDPDDPLLASARIDLGPICTKETLKELRK